MLAWFKSSPRVLSRKQKNGIMPTMRCHLTFSTAAALAAAAMLAVTLDDGARAQTLTDPSPQPALSRPLVAKPDTNAKVKSCSAYGAGFVNIPGTETCVKIGGSVTVDAATSRGR
jgi:Porin subfamily